MYERLCLSKNFNDLRMMVNLGSLRNFVFARVTHELT